MDSCPFCERQFKKIDDFPLVYIAEVSIMRPKDIPVRIESFPERLVEVLTQEMYRNGEKYGLVPPEVLAYFKEHPDKYRFVHSDNFSYETSLESVVSPINEESPVLLRKWYRRANLAPLARKLMIENESLKQYFNGLRELVGQETSPSRVMPDWQYDYCFKAYNIPKSENVQLFLNDSGVRFEDGRREISLGFCAFRGRDRDYFLEKTLGCIKYEGRLRK